MFVFLVLKIFFIKILPSLSESSPTIDSCLPCPIGKFCASNGLTAPEGNCSAGYICYNGSTVSQPSQDNSTGFHIFCFMIFSFKFFFISHFRPQANDIGSFYGSKSRKAAAFDLSVFHKFFVILVGLLLAELFHGKIIVSVYFTTFHYASMS